MCIVYGEGSAAYEVRFVKWIAVFVELSAFVAVPLLTGYAEGGCDVFGVVGVVALA